MVAEKRATRMLILIPVFAVLLALLFSMTGLNMGMTVAERPTAPRALIHAAVLFSDALYITATGAQALVARRQ